MQIYDIEGYDSIIDSFNDIVIVVDLKNTIKSYNRRAYEFFSFDKNFLKDKSIVDFMKSFEINIHDRFVNEEEFDFNQIVTGDIFHENLKTIVLKKTFRRKDLFFKLGIYKHKISNEDIVGNIFILTDITDIYNAYKDLHKNNDLMKQYVIEMKGIMDIRQRTNKKKDNHVIHVNNIINNLHEGIIVVDNAFTDISCNDAYGNIINFTPREFISLKFLNNYEVECIGDSKNNIRDFLKNLRYKSEKKSEKFLFRNVVDGTEKYFQITINSIDSSDISNIKYYNIITFSDITELKQQEILKDDFFNMVSHELRTPITLIKSSLQALENICKDEITLKMKKYLNMMNKNSSRLLKLINNILDLSKAESGYMSPVITYFDIVVITEDIVTSINVHANHKKNIQVIFEPNVEEAYLFFDKDMYEKILLNLLSNAIKFTPNNKFIYVDLIINENSFILKVRDQGVGIPNDKLKDIFDKFVQINSILSRGAEGSGIGLSLVKKFVDILGGKVKIESRVGIGTDFTLEFKKMKLDNPNNNVDDVVINDNINGRVDIYFSDIYP